MIEDLLQMVVGYRGVCAHSQGQLCYLKDKALLQRQTKPQLRMLIPMSAHWNQDKITTPAVIVPSEDWRRSLEAPSVLGLWLHSPVFKYLLSDVVVFHGLSQPFSYKGPSGSAKSIPRLELCNNICKDFFFSSSILQFP